MHRQAGYSLIELLITLGIITLALGLVLAGIQRVRNSSSQLSCQNHLRQCALATANYHQQHGRLPTGMHTPRGPYPFMSWMTQLLPMLEQSTAWAEAGEDYNRQRIFSKPIPHRNLARPMAIFLCPADGRQMGTTEENITAAFTNYLGVSGSAGHRRNGVLFDDSRIRYSEITDGVSHTLLLGERPPSAGYWFGWWYAGTGQDYRGSLDSVMDVSDQNVGFRFPTCVRGPYRFQPGTNDDDCSSFHFWSHHPGGAHFAFADGAVKFFRYSAHEILRSLATRAGGESAAIPE